MADQKDVERNCPECDGTGQDRGMHPVRLGEKNEFRPCTRCGGSGKIKQTAAARYCNLAAAGSTGIVVP